MSHYGLLLDQNWLELDRKTQPSSPYLFLMLVSVAFAPIDPAFFVRQAVQQPRKTCPFAAILYTSSCIQYLYNAMPSVDLSHFSVCERCQGFENSKYQLLGLKMANLIFSLQPTPKLLQRPWPRAHDTTAVKAN